VLPRSESCDGSFDQSSFAAARDCIQTRVSFLPPKLQSRDCSCSLRSHPGLGYVQVQPFWGMMEWRRNVVGVRSELCRRAQVLKVNAKHS
jgi:hypothetical protein